MSDTVECVVVGAGVIGLAIARALALRGHRTLIIERERRFGAITSARNSAVIHAGLHYPQGSLKARLCVAGRARLYAYCAQRHIGHRRCGKLIVASEPGQVAGLAAIAATAEADSVYDLEPLDGDQARRLEPALRVEAALLSPSTGIVDSHGLMLALLADAEAAAATIAYGASVDRIRVESDGLAVGVGGADRLALKARLVVNAAGLDAASLAAAVEGFPTAHLPRMRWAKGNYFGLDGAAPFDRLIYPLPEPGGLGIHLTLDLAGRARFGPDVEWIDDIAYDVDPGRAERFASAIRSYWPGLDPARLVPAYAGIRPKLSGPGEPAADFRIDGPDIHGVPGLINLFGIESPGLTASLALAELVAEQAVPILGT